MIQESLQNPSRALGALCKELADVHYLTEVESTNTWLKEQYELGAVTRPALVLADSQTAGRGTRGREWLQAGEDIALSCGTVIPADIEIDQRLSLAVGSIVAEAIENVTGLSARVKWPNDVLTRPLREQDSQCWRKVSGTLIETILGAQRRLVVVGVGVNVNSTAAGYPPELSGRLITLRDALDSPAKRIGLATHLSLHLLNLVILLSGSTSELETPARDIDRLVGNWFKRDVTAGTRYLMHRDGNRFPVVASRVDRQTCALVCRDDREREYLVTSYTELSPEPGR